MKRFLILLTALLLVLAALPSCAGKSDSYDLYSGAAEQLSKTTSAAITLTSKVLDDSGENVLKQTVTEYCINGDDMSLKLSVDGKEKPTAHYTYLGGTLYSEISTAGNEKWKTECARNAIASATGVSIDMGFITKLPTLEKKDFKNVTVTTNGTYKKITVKIPQSLLTGWIAGITGAAEVEASSESIETTLLFDQNGTVNSVYLRFQISVGTQVIKVDVTVSYADVDAQKPITLPSSESKYQLITLKQS